MKKKKREPLVVKSILRGRYLFIKGVSETFGDLCAGFVYLSVHRAVTDTAVSVAVTATGCAAGLDSSLQQHARVHG